MAAQNQLPISIPKDLPQMEEEINFSERAQWLRAAVLGANDGLVTIASLILGVGALKHDARAIILAGFAGLFAGACSMAIGEFVSVYTQLDIEKAQIKREKAAMAGNGEEAEREALPNPWQAAAASAIAFSLGAVLPLLVAAFVEDHRVREGVVVAATTAGLVGFGGAGAVLGRTKVVRSCVRVVVGGWMAMAITFGLTKLLGSSGFEM
ncbi:vacuolar iron transporter homolog 4-like [Salvia hispanica]|uniref:vacuolar iron transporter homolog 4-like n=1 Tax=Salvia hispanica TaxID=49212 RepID=UPI002009DAFB|nr:vacuolar iron transporter homolog 4-like [Salvia hispanica]